ncbi:MAG TPA: HI0074 family nucleotidyltransferase substrate-binding subunit [Sphingopyxis sp.]|jgi:nucleotidyltransferase substrate binding protein (TIGR01987 family)|uniref:HI0074 family nucleotidyltransferase substrate-binding subunit n=1 Tax=Sphingopyxis sp. TaxID=1908224 RepID=UPI002E149272|nr:HI0074 family nucleotidyltransferase substrate-binding subunit [Sphingopyxis sp.]
MDDKPPPRSQLRLDNFSRALAGLKEAVDLRQNRPLSELEKAGMVQRFEIAWELGWKLLADQLAEELAPPEALTPASTIRAAHAAGMIAAADEWLAMGKLRNQLSHTYSEPIRNQGLELIAGRFLTILTALERTSDARHA